MTCSFPFNQQSHLQCFNYAAVSDRYFKLCVCMRACVCVCVLSVNLLKGAFLQCECQLQLIIISDYIRGN